MSSVHSGLTSTIHSLFNTTSHAWAEHTAHDAEHLASQDVAHLSTRQKEKPGFFQNAGNVMKEMMNIVKRGLGILSPEEKIAIQTMQRKETIKQMLDVIVHKDESISQYSSGLKANSFKSASIESEAKEHYRQMGQQLLISFAHPETKALFFEALEEKVNAFKLSETEKKKRFLANIEELIPHIKFEAPEELSGEEYKPMREQLEAYVNTYKNELLAFCKKNKLSSALSVKLDDWMSKYQGKVSRADSKLLNELMLKSKGLLSSEEDSALTDLKQKELTAAYNLKLVEVLERHLSEHQLEEKQKTAYQDALKRAKKVYNADVELQAIPFPEEELQALKPYLSSDDTRAHVLELIVRRIDQESGTKTPSYQLEEKHKQAFEAFLKRYQTELEKAHKDELKLGPLEEERFKKLLKSFDTSQPWGTNTLTDLISNTGLNPEASAGIAQNVAGFANTQAKSWMVNSLLGSLIRPVFGNRGTSLVTATALSSWNKTRPGKAIRLVGTEMIFDHHANKVLKDMHPWINMGWNFFGRGVVVSAIHDQVSKLKFITTIEDSISAGFSRIKKGLTSW